MSRVITRRRFVRGVAVAATMPDAAVAQPAARVARIGYMTLRPVTGRGLAGSHEGFQPQPRARADGGPARGGQRASQWGNLVLVSHGSTIYALTGTQPAPGEFVV
jgi:hypothetical protein